MAEAGWQPALRSGPRLLAAGWQPALRSDLQPARRQAQRALRYNARPMTFRLHIPPCLRLPLILALYLLLALTAGVVNPLFEAPDEHFHFFTVQFIHQERRLPVLLPGDAYDPFMSQEAAQPPLYYLLGALLTAPFDLSAAREQVWLNPFVRLGDAGSPMNINAAVRTPAERWPWQGYAAAAHLLRAFSAVIGLGTLLCIHAAGRLVWPAQPERALAATAAVACLPQFIFHHGAITNDVLVIFWCSLAFYLLLRIWPTAEPSPRAWAGLGVVIGLAMLSKTAGLLLLIYAVGVSGLLAWRRRSAVWLWRGALPLLTTALLTAGWLLVRNARLYDGDITAASQFVRVMGGDRGYTPWQVLAESSSIAYSFFGVFGWMNVRAPNWLYALYVALTAAAGVGALRRLVQARRAGRWETLWFAALLAGWPLLVYAGMFQFMLRTPAAQGRLLFPALLPLALAAVAGWSALPGGRFWQWAAGWTGALGALVCLGVVIPRAYAPAAVVSAEAVPATALRLEADLGEQLTLTAAVVETPARRPGEQARFTLFWRVERPYTPTDPVPELVIDLFGRDGVVIGRVHTYHGQGRDPAVFWPVGALVRDEVWIPIDRAAETPTAVTALARLATAARTVEIGRFKLTDGQPSPPLPALAQLGTFAHLTAAQLDRAQAQAGETVTLHVQWQAVGAPGRDYTAFVHLGDPTQPPLAQGDAPPRDYPTRFWEPGELILDRYDLALPADLPPGRYPVWLGLYDPADGARLPLVVDGVRQPHDAWAVGVLTVSAPGR